MKQFLRKLISGYANALPIVIGLFLAVVGLIFFFCYDPDVYDGQTTATITRIEEEWDVIDEETDYTVFVNYTAMGHNYQDVQYGGYNSSMREGDTIEIYYKSTDPSQITGSDKNIAPYFGLLFAVVGAGIIFFQVRRIRREHTAA